jgi:hypothetical protein
MARDGEIDLSYVLSAEVLADCFTHPLPKPVVLKQCAMMGIIGIELGSGLRNGVWKGLGNGLGIGIGNGLRNGFRNCIGTRNGIRNAIGK